MKDQLKLPEGYIPIEYIGYRPKQENLFVYGNFERYKEAMALANRINDSCKESVCQIITVQHSDNVLFCLVFSESIFERVEFIKKEECQICNTPTNVIYNTPIVYRFIDEQYIDEFWEKGVLKLTTFSKCKELEDKNRKDDREGLSELFGHDGQYTLQIGVGVGSDAIMLCTSLCSNYTSSDNKDYNKYIEIFDVKGLLFAIAEQLIEKGYSINEILYGPCFYTKKEFHKTVKLKRFGEKLDNEQVNDLDELSKITGSIGGKNLFFQKPIDKRMENEFRMIWVVNELKNDKDIFITISQPDKFCKLIKEE